MKIVVAPDSFKGSLAATTAASAMARGLKQARPDATVIALPIADGGEGTLAVVAERTTSVEVIGANGERRAARLGWRSDAAVVEVAQAVALPDVPADQRDPWHLSTQGVGQLIAHALHQKARTIWVALGGSATVDAGAGMLTALGALLLDAANEPLDPHPAAWAATLEHVDLREARRSLEGVSLIGLADVTSPLGGPEGARRFMAQKGVREQDLDRLEAALLSLATATGAPELGELAGAGAAGGIGFALYALGGEVRSGATEVLTLVGLEAALSGADLFITGEGSFDAQSIAGKATGTALSMADAAGVPAAVICGVGTSESRPLVAIGEGRSEQEAMEQAEALVEQAAKSVLDLVFPAR